MLKLIVIQQSIIVKINPEPTNRSSATILFDSRRGPTPKLNTVPVLKTRYFVIMRVPEWQTSEQIAPVSPTQDGSPHVPGGIDAHTAAIALQGVDEGLDELAVGVEVAHRPGAVGAGVGLDVQPDGARRVGEGRRLGLHRV